MQIHALTDKGHIVAAQAERHKNYRCLECLGAVRARGGPHRQPHFYHLQTAASCRLAQKTLIHLNIQSMLQQLLPSSVLERPFPSMGRIADLVWEQEKMVVEVQCSPISLEEAQARERDYTMLGYRLVWILHDARFNQKNLGAAENFLRGRWCYFSNIDEKGRGIIYDQFEVLKKEKRLFRGAPLRVDLSRPLPFPEVLAAFAPEVLRKRAGVCFAGDLLDRFQKTPHPSMLEVERRFQTKAVLRMSVLRWLKKSYTTTLHALLEMTQK